jgi:Holliday junction resolvase RusA-like endonuclease
MNGKADVDNLAKLVLDSLTGRAFADDTQVVRLLAVKKYATGHGEGYTKVRLVLQ